MFFHCVDIAKINGWLMYRRYCEQVGVQKRNIKPLLEFTRELSEGVMNAGETKLILGRPKKSTKSSASTRTSNVLGTRICSANTRQGYQIRYDRSLA